MSDEYFDTGNDPRIIFSINVLNKALSLAKSQKIGVLRKINIDARLNELINLLNQIRYMYLPKEDLVQSEQFLKMMKIAKNTYFDLMSSYRDLIKSNEYVVKWIRFALRNALSLKDRLVSYPDKPSSAVESCFVKVLSILKHPKAEKLFLASVTDGDEKFDIITNDKSVKSNEVLLLSFLPPKEFNGITSEGMFIGPNGIRRGSENDIGARPELSDTEEKKILAEIFTLIK